MIEIAATAKVSLLADLEDSVRGSRIVVGAGSVIDAFVKFKPAGGKGDIIIGEDCVINSGCVFYTGNGITVGCNSIIASNCTLAPVNHEYLKADVPIRRQGFRPSKGGILIEEDVWIGANCVLLDGAILRQGVVVAASSVVRGELESYGIYAGNPIQLKGFRK